MEAIAVTRRLDNEYRYYNVSQSDPDRDGHHRRPARPSPPEDILPAAVLVQYPDIISAGQTCLRWASLCHPLWAKIAEEIVESWSQEKFIPSEENIRIATILGMIRFMGLLHYNFKTTNKTTTSNRYI